jgi:hypothetical protein
MTNDLPLEDDLTAPRLSISISPMVTESDPNRKKSRMLSSTPTPAKKIDVQAAQDDRHRRSVSRSNGTVEHFELDDAGKQQSVKGKENEKPPGKTRAPAKKKAPAKKNTTKKNVPEDDTPDRNLPEGNVTESNVNDEGVSGPNSESDEEANTLFIPEPEPRTPTLESDSTLSRGLTPTPSSSRLSATRFTTAPGTKVGATIDKGKGPAQATSGPVSPSVGVDKAVSKPIFKAINYAKPSKPITRKGKKLPFPQGSDDPETVDRRSPPVPEIHVQEASPVNSMLDADEPGGSNYSQQSGGRQHSNHSQHPAGSQQSHGSAHHSKSSLPEAIQSTPIDVDGLPQEKDSNESRSTPADDDEDPKVVLEEQAKDMLPHILKLACQLLHDTLMAEYRKADATGKEVVNPHTPSGKSDAEGNGHRRTLATAGAPSRSHKRSATEQGGREGASLRKKPKAN